jgi:hypothetical protein
MSELYNSRKEQTKAPIARSALVYLIQVRVRIDTKDLRHMRCFFDVDGDGGPTKDLDGSECGTLVHMRQTALGLLAEIAAHTRHHEDHHRVTVQVRNPDGAPLYKASLTIEGTVLAPF